MFSVLVITLLGVAFAADPLVWPLPSTHTISNALSVNVDAAAFKCTSNVPSTIVANACARYVMLSFPHTPEGTPDNGLPSITGLTLNIKDGSENTLGYGMDESYSLSMTGTATTATLTANTIWGALRGLETFSQLVIFNTDIRYYQAYTASISDMPRFSHRGILVDTSRHFQSVDSLLGVLDAMAYNKFNVLHWHITDSQSFPYESLVYPKLWKGSYTVYERYIQNDIKQVVAYAKERGIRVIPEFDMPGHAQSWCDGYPGICPSPSCQSPLNPAVNMTWDLLEAVIKEISNLWIDDHIHLGGDEVNTNCWSQTASVQAWMTAQGFTAKQALQYFDERVINIGAANGKTVIDWDEVYSNFASSLDPSKSIVQVWHSGAALLPDVVKDGFRGIFSPDPTWYLDSLGTTWQTRYKLEPLAFISDPAQQKLVIGGEACMWGETVDVSDIEQTIWPTASAVAERLWSPRNINDTTAAAPRMEYFRCLLNERGIAAAPAKNTHNRAAPPGPGSCYNQRRR